MSNQYTGRKPVEERFWPKVDRDRVGGCWIWTGSTQNGYGAFCCWKTEAGWKIVRAHRFAYELLVGPIPTGLQIDHLCRNTLCVNPEHP